MKERKPAPEIIYTTEDLYNYQAATYKPIPYKGYDQNAIDNISNSILDLISKGMSTTQACNKLDIDTATLGRWCDKDPQLYGRYVRACERLGLALFDRILEEVDSMHTVEDSIIASKKIDALKWLSGKLNQRFSDRSDIYIQNVNNTLNTSTNELPAADRAKIMQSILSKLNSKIDALPGPGPAEQ